MHDLMRRQCGVVSRAQLIALGCRPHDIARLVRRRELTQIHPGVFVGHTGEPTWTQRAWAGVLHCQRVPGAPDPESSALHGLSALVAFEGVAGRPTHPIEVAIADNRKVRAPTGVTVRRSSATLARVQWQLGPPRVRYEDAVVEVAARQQTMVDLVAVVANAVGSRRTTTARLRASLERRTRTAQRDLVAAVVDDVATGACSALEHGYLHRVERAHGLPRAARQTRGASRTSVTYRDADYGGLVVELDGRAWHDSVAQRDRDADRDLVAVATGSATVRLTWGQVFDRSCWTAGQIARLLGARPRRCAPRCTVLDL